MQQMTQWLLVETPVLLLTALATHLVVSFSQTLLHRTLAHHRRGGVLQRHHLGFHHAHYAKDHLVSAIQLAEDGNLTPLFVIPVLIFAGIVYLVLPLPFVVTAVAAAAGSFYAHVLLDKEYHIEASWLLRFAWFRHKQELHFVHHRHANRNFAVIDFFWDRLFGTYRAPPVRQEESASFGKRSKTFYP